MQNEKAQGLKDGLVKLIEALATDTDEARQSTLFTSYLRACGLFHNYSWHNCALIWSQKGHSRRDSHDRGKRQRLCQRKG
jgi:hypothetical protein